MRRFLTLAAAASLAACTATQVQQATTTAAGVNAKITAACAEAVPLANLAIGLPTIGPFIAAGVQIGCATNSGLARLAADPNSAAWVNQQIGLLRAALGK